MKAKQAADLFHGKEGFNCAQAVLKAFQPESGMSDMTILSAQVAGGGRAKGGVCGALYAAQIILGEGEHSEQVKCGFVDATGSALCSDIKQDECQCRELVKTAAQLTTCHLDKIDHADPDYVFEREIREVEMLPQSV
ncbi:C-GCAxxG-C-C family protein [Vibrio sp. JC009]|uniref:C-GCAxxG-C-C family (seleno)protein n=1 Tax=Vibrio sp. JC009 TaxID=2912314 RepID=UPI0023AE93BB|nr:C-GCAxxG-C-C family (seleno)protein [Vibrio sp. JC009]WED21255.1 C-GCAxxG-C-C family protein [Vibrio sp. JC009]